jgi:hypothetical protein
VRYKERYEYEDRVLVRKSKKKRDFFQLGKEGILQDKDFVQK